MQQQPQDDRRTSRRRVLKGVKIAFSNDYCAVEGAMKNIPVTDALIQLKDGYLVPDQIGIYNELQGYKVPCEVVRRDTSRIGVRFTGEKIAIETTKSQVVNMLDIGKTDHEIPEQPMANNVVRTYDQRKDLCLENSGGNNKIHNPGLIPDQPG